MGAGWSYRILVAGAALALLLVIADFGLAQANHAIQVEVNHRQQFINQSIALAHVNQVLVRSIAIAAVKNKDSKLGAILTDQGIRITPAAPAPPAPTRQERH